MRRHWTRIVLVHKEDGRILCNDGERRKHLNPLDAKLYRQRAAAEKRAGFDYACHFLYEGDVITADARILRADQ